MIDVVIPCLKQDLRLLKLCILGIRLNVIDEICKIYIISPNDSDIREFCNENELVFIEETSVLNISTNTINKPRAGWLLQLLLKLSGNIGECENYLVIDADHILLKPHQFINNDNSYNFYYDEEYHRPYFNTMNLLSKGKYDKLFEHSFISDKMIINKKLLLLMKNEYESINNKEWNQMIIDIFGLGMFSFSEFETYGTYLYSNYKDKIRFIYSERKMSYTKIEDKTFELLIKENMNYSSITLHKTVK